MKNDDFVYLFSPKKYIEEKEIERDILRKEYTNPIFLFLSTSLKLEYVIYFGPQGRNANCVTKKDTIDIIDFEKFKYLSHWLYRFSQSYIHRKSEYLEDMKLYRNVNYERGERNEWMIRSADYTNYLKERIFGAVDHFEDIEIQIQLIDGFINYLTQKLEYNFARSGKRNSDKIRWIKELKILKYSLEGINNSNNSKKGKSLLISGKKPNISERYYIANKVFNIEEILNQKNILQDDKSILLALILGCNKQTARELLNGTQQLRTPINEKILKHYLDSLN